MEHEKTRSLMADIEQTLVRVESAAGTPEIAAHLLELRGAWTSLVTCLALGPAPEVRACPVCHGVIMRAATRCVHCWAKSVDLTPESPSAES